MLDRHAVPAARTGPPAPSLPLGLGLGPITVPRPPQPDTTLPDLLVALPTGEQASLPGFVWPQVAVAQPRRGHGGRSNPKPLIAVREADIKTADRLLERWRHPLPPASRRPFGRMTFVLEAFGEPVAVTVSASTPNTSVHQDYGLHRYNTVELARIARRDKAATLAALRLWREYLAPLYAERYAASGWGAEPLAAAVSYSLPGTPSSSPDSGGIYRRDGWVCLRRRKAPPPGRSSRNKPSAAAAINDGIMGLWAWPFRPLERAGDQGASR